jgi:hypothetical protein
MQPRDPKVIDAALQCLTAYQLPGDQAVPIETFLAGLAQQGWSRKEVDAVTRTLISLLEATAPHPLRRRDLWFEGPYVRKYWRAATESSPPPPKLSKFKKRSFLRRAPRRD